MLTIGDRLPNFNLSAIADLSLDQLNMNNAFIKISDTTYIGKWKLIFFYPKDFTFVCPTEIIAFANMFNEFKKRKTQILGCSTDSEFVHWAWRKYNPALSNIPYPLMSDTKKELSSFLGVLDEETGVAHRALFIIDPENIIRFVMVTDQNVGRNPAEALRVLDALQTGSLCQCEWTPGQKTIDLKEVNI